VSAHHRLRRATGTRGSNVPNTEDNNYLGAVRGNFPGDDDTLLMAGRGACRLLYTGSGTEGAIDATAAQYGASPGQAAAVVSAARGNFCTQAPG
jgi:Protein of unknown function (DUF732)